MPQALPPPASPSTPLTTAELAALRQQMPPIASHDEPLTAADRQVLAKRPPAAPPSFGQVVRIAGRVAKNVLNTPNPLTDTFTAETLAPPMADSAIDVVKHPIRNLPLIGGGVGGAIGGLPGAAAGAYGGEAARQLIEAGTSAVTGGPPERVASTPGGVVTSSAREAVTSGLLPEAFGRGAGKLLHGVLRPPPNSADAAVAATSKALGLGLTVGEIRSSTAGQAARGVEKVGSIGAAGHAITTSGRAAGEAEAHQVLAGQLDALAAPVTASEAGATVRAAARDAEARLRDTHDVVQHTRALAHGRLEAARRATHQANEQAALDAHRQAQAAQAAIHDAAEAAKADQFRATNQATFDAAHATKQAAGKQMEAVSRQVHTPVNNAAVKAEAQRLIETELRPPAEAYPLKVLDATAAAADDFLSDRPSGGGKLAFQDLPPDVQALLRARIPTTGATTDAEIDPLQNAKKILRDHLTRIANAPDTADFGAAWKYYSELLADSKFLKQLKSPGEGQLSALATAQRAGLEEAAKASGVDWATTSAAHATAADASREALRGLSKRYTPKVYRPTAFTRTKYTPEKFTPDKFSATANLKRLLTEEPSQLLKAFERNGQIVPERIAAARKLLTGVAARGGPVGSPAAVRGQQAWDQFRTTLVRERLLTEDMPGLQARLQRFGSEGLKELFLDAPQVPAQLQRIGEAFARRSPLAPTWQYRTLEALMATGSLLHTPGSAVGTMATLEGVPAVIAWAAHSPRWTSMLLEGVTAQNHGQALANLTRVVEAWRTSGGVPEPRMVPAHAARGGPPGPKTATPAGPPPGPGR